MAWKKRPSSEFDNKRNVPQMPSKSKIERAGHEMKEDPPAQLSRTKKKFGRKAAQKQKIAIMLNKARKS